MAPSPTAPFPHPRNFHEETWHSPQGKLIREVVFGMNDGLITTIGFLAGISLAISDRSLVLLTVVAEVFAGTVSMAVGAYLSAKSQREFFQREIDRERREIEETPEHEANEIREIFTAKGFTADEAEMIVRRVTADKERFLDFMLKEELGLVRESFDNPYTVGSVMGVSFLAGGLVPMVPLLLPGLDRPFPWSLGLTLVTLFGLGVGKARLARRSMWLGGMEILVLGSLAAALGYLLGALFHL